MVLVAAVVGAISGLLLVYSTELPEVSELDRYRPSAITELYDDQGREIGSFALQRRVIVGYDDLPKVLRDAVLSTEDKEFEQHWGVDLWRVLGALYHDIRYQGRGPQGASTLTMQLSRNLFLSPERTLRRKIQEVMLSIQIERRFTKPQIFTMYANQIYLGHGVYGFEAGAEFYFNKRARDLTLEEAAMLAALPKSAIEYSPITHPDRALQRRNLVINSMLEDGKITREEATRAKNMPIRLVAQQKSDTVAPWFAEEVRRYLERKYGSEQVHEGGLRVYTSLNLEMQKAAQQALLDGLAAYERRHGWKTRLENVRLAGQAKLSDYWHPDWDNPLEPGGYVHGLVTNVSTNSATVKLGRYEATLGPGDIRWTGRRSPREILTAGDIVYVKIASLGPDGKARIGLEQDSGAQGAVLVLDNATGDIKAMVGGRDYELSKFNRATQALRQVGSSFKPYVYTAVVDAEGYSPDDIILDAPTTFMTVSGPYTPHNYDNKFEGNITLRHALAESRNIPALKLAQEIGIKQVIDYARRFGITSPIPPYLPVALGSADLTLYEQTSAFSVFPNDGVRVTPRTLRRVTDYEGHVLEENFPEVRDAIPSGTARIVTAMMREVIQRGTAAKAASMKHALAGKTGTTNDFTDAWFIGFSPSITCGVWVGYDEKKSLGPKETGAQAALPIWMDVMKAALKGRENEDFALPPVRPPNPAALARREDTPEVKPGEETQ
jgi:penicillin-binding protein 1A